MLRPEEAATMEAESSQLYATVTCGSAMAGLFAFIDPNNDANLDLLQTCLYTRLPRKGQACEAHCQAKPAASLPPTDFRTQSFPPFTPTALLTFCFPCAVLAEENPLPTSTVRSIMDKTSRYSLMNTDINEATLERMGVSYWLCVLNTHVSLLPGTYPYG
jgi:hypothetical protein